jgi:hypothetical protein
MEDPSAFHTEIDPSSIKVEDEFVVAHLVVMDRFQNRHTFSLTWKAGHEADWKWRGDDAWLQTEQNAERLGIDPAQLIRLTDAAVGNAAMMLNTRTQT